MTVRSFGREADLTRGNRSPWWLVVAMASITYMAMLDMTVVTVALPTITDDLRVTPAVSEWLVLAYLLPLVGFSLPAGRWVDGVPWRTSLAVSIIGFAASSVLVALSPGATGAIVSRGLQGGFAALLFALAPAVASTAVPPSARGRAMSVIATVGPLGAISGYGAGALILDSLGWRWAFYLNMPIAAAGLAIVLTVMPASRERLQPPSRDMALEAVTLLLGAGGLLAGLSLTAGREAGWLGLSLAALVPILVWTRSEPGRAAIDRLRVPSVRQPHVSLLLEAFAFGGATFALPFLLGAGEAHASRSVGLLLLVLPLASICGSAFGGVLADRATARLSAVLGAAVLAIGLAIAARANSAWDLPDFLWAVVLAGAGAGCFSGANQALAMTAAAPGEAASTGASTNVARQLGFAIGPATVTAIWAAQDYATDGLSQAMALAAGASVAAAVALLPPARPPHTTGMNQRKERP